jgi:hypothetical protein
MKSKWFTYVFLMMVVTSITIMAAAKEAVQIKEWNVTTPQSFPHDPAVAVTRSAS